MRRFATFFDDGRVARHHHAFRDVGQHCAASGDDRSIADLHPRCDEAIGGDPDFVANGDRTSDQGERGVTVIVRARAEV